MTTPHNELLSALSTVGSCTRQQFEAYCLEIVGKEARAPFLRRSLARLAHIDFFPSDRAYISVTPPSLAITNTREKVSEAFLCGSRTAGFLETVVSIARDRDIEVRRIGQVGAPDIVKFRAESEINLEHFAQGAGLRFAGAAARRLARVLPSPCLRENACVSRSQFQEKRIAWLNLDSAEYEAESGQQVSACAISPRFGGNIYYFVRGNKAWQMDRYEATHLVASLNALKWVRYSEELCVLTVLGKAPLPYLYERAAVLCSGAEPAFSESTRTLDFTNVAPDVARAILSGLGRCIEVND